MGAPRSYPARELSRLRREWLQRNWILVAGTGVFYLVTLVGSMWWGFAASRASSWYLLGLFHAGLTAAFLHILNMAVLAHEPRAIHQLRGSWGEDNTRSELQAASRKRLIWGWVDSIALQGGDLDHVVVTRDGGVVVLDSKFHTSVSAASIAEMTRAAGRARLRAEGLARQLLKTDRSGRHRSATRSVTVTTCIVVWGPVKDTVPLDHVVDGVHFVDGRRLRDWLGKLPSSPVSEDAGKELLAGLASRREAHATSP